MRGPNRSAVARQSKLIAARVRAVDLYQQGGKITHIARLLHRTRNFVYAAINRKRYYSLFTNRKSTGRPLKFPAKQRASIAALLHNKRGGSLRKAHAKARAKGINVSLSTLHRIATEDSLLYYARRPRPALTADSKIQRLAWAKAQLKVSIAKQFMYVFADEKQFTIEDGKAGVWLYPWEERPTRRTKKFPKRVRVSGVITSEGAASLVAYPIDASFDAEEYKATLRTQHIPAVRAMLKGRQFTFIHDNASVHYAGVVAEWMEGEGVSTDATFPPYSPDLNLIENVWGVMAQHLSSQDFETERQLLHALRKEWDSLDLPYLQRLYWSFRDRLKAVIQAEGGNTKY